jgi:hypothetical protein
MERETTRVPHDVLQSVFGWIDGSEFQATIGLVCRQWYLVARREINNRRLRDRAVQTHIRRLIRELQHAIVHETTTACLVEMEALVRPHSDRSNFHIVHAHESSLSPIMDAFLFVHKDDFHTSHLAATILKGCLESKPSRPMTFEQMKQTKFFHRLLEVIVHVTRPTQDWIESAVYFMDGVRYVKDIALEPQHIDILLSWCPPGCLSSRLDNALDILCRYCTGGHMPRQQLSNVLSWLVSQLKSHLPTDVFQKVERLAETLMNWQANIGLCLEILVHNDAFTDIMRQSLDAPESRETQMVQQVICYVYMGLTRFPHSDALHDAVMSAKVEPMISLLMHSTARNARCTGISITLEITREMSIHIQHFLDVGCLAQIFQSRLRPCDTSLIPRMWTELIDALTRHATAQQLQTCAELGMMSLVLHCMENLTDGTAMRQLFQTLHRLFESGHPENQDAHQSNAHLRLFRDQGGFEMLRTLTLLEDRDPSNHGADPMDFISVYAQRLLDLFYAV